MRGLKLNLQNSFSIKKMIMMGLSIMTLLVCIVGILGTLGQYAVRKNAEQMIANDIPALNHLNTTLALGLSMKDFTKEIEPIVTNLDADDSVTTIKLDSLKTEQLEKVNDTYKELLDSLTDYSNATTHYPRAQELSADVKTAATSLFVASRYAIETPNDTTRSKLSEDEKSFSNSLSALSSFSSTLLADKGNKNIATANTVGIAILAFTLLSALLCWFITKLLWRNIFSKVTQLQQAVNSMEKGEFLSESDAPIASLIASNNEFSVLAKSLVAMSTTVNKKTEALKNNILFDSATSLPNQMALKERLGVAVLKPKHNFALMLLNCNRIEKVKESYGSTISDLLCQEIGIRITKNVKTEDFVVHLNKDEFAILLEPIHSQEEVLDVAKRIMSSLALPFEVHDHIIDVTGHLGIVFADHSYTTIDIVMTDAEMAMQKAKEAGPGRWKVFKTSIKNDHELRIQLVKDLREAIDNDGLELYYQSIIDLEKRTINGFEALVRWKHPERGEIFPDTFIPIAEENDLIYDLDLYVMKKASQQIKAWNLQFNNNHNVNINMSSQSLIHSQLLDDFDRLVEAYNLNPEFLSLDINENFLVDNSKHARIVLQKLRGMGVTIILDDFGTGYSAISNLQNSQVDEVKIDRSFIQDIHNKEDRLNMVNTIVTLAQNMKLRVTAEGVESKAQLYLLEELGCNYAQGYLFTKPKDIHDIEKMLEKQRVRRAKNASTQSGTNRNSTSKDSGSTSGSKKVIKKPGSSSQPVAVPPLQTKAQPTEHPRSSRQAATNPANLTDLASQAHPKQQTKQNKAVQDAEQPSNSSKTPSLIEEVQIQHPVNQTSVPEMTKGAPKTLLLADSDLRQTMYDETPA